MPTIILSYTIQDKEVARQLADGLEQFGHAIWLDEWLLKPDRYISKSLDSTLDHIDFMIVLLSRRESASAWLEREWKRMYWDMVQEKEVPVLPVCLDQREVPSFFQVENRVSLSKSFEKGVREIQNLVDYNIQKKLLKQAKAVPDHNPDNIKRLLAQKLENRASHWGRLQEFIDGLQGNEKLRIQKLNTAYYLEYYHLTVAHLKEWFQFLGVYQGEVDNQLDADLIYAITQFQVDYDLPHVDGIFGPLTYAVLEDKIRTP